MTRPEIHAALSDRAAFIATLEGECANEPIEGQIAVACVIRNRATHPRWWGTGYKGVCLAPSQFSCWWEDNDNTARVHQVAEGLWKRQPTGERSTLSQLAWIVDGLMSEQVKDITDGADHYVTRRLLQKHPPDWTRGRKDVGAWGSHVFFKLEL